MKFGPVDAGSGDYRFRVTADDASRDNGRFYDGPITIPSTTLIAARAFKSGMAASSVATGQFAITTQPMQTGFRTYHEGNSLTDGAYTFIRDVCRSAG